ncbi:unnamed protein product, partial [Choristocarpus tenellus]
SGEKIKIATEGEAAGGTIVSNQNHHLIQFGKAKKTRWLGFRSILRGVAINSVDHPH